MITTTNTTTLEDGVTVFEIKGRLHLGNLLQSTETALKKLIDGGARKVVVDLAGLEYIDSAGIGMLVACFGHMDDQGGKLRVAGAQGGVAKTLGVAKVERLIPFDADVAAARANL